MHVVIYNISEKTALTKLRRVHYCTVCHSRGAEGGSDAPFQPQESDNNVSGGEG